MERRIPSRYFEIYRLYRLMEKTTLKYLSIEKLHELGIEAKQVELLNDDKLQFDPSFFEPQHHNLHETYPLLDKTEKIPDLTYRPNWDRCLRGAVGAVAYLVKVRHMSADELKNNGEEELFKIARRQYRWEQEKASLARVDICSRSQSTLLYMESLLGAERDHPNDPRTEEDAFHLRDLTPLLEGWRYVFPKSPEYTQDILTIARTKERKGDPDLASFDWERDIRWRIEDIIEDWEAKDPKPHAVLWNWVEFEAGVAPECLTIHEVQSIVRWFLIRVKRSTWKKHRIQPVSHVVCIDNETWMGLTP